VSFLPSHRVVLQFNNNILASCLLSLCLYIVQAVAVQNNNVIKLDITGGNLANFFINLPKGMVIMGAERETNTDIYRVRFGTTIRK
jgi:hypothetical protein